MESSCYLVSRLLVTLVALCLVPWCSAQTCVATGENSACTESERCRDEYPRGVRDDNVCMAGVEDHSPSAGSCLRPTITCSSFSGDRPDVHVHFYALNWKYFSLTVSWTSNASTGAQIVIRGWADSMTDCDCLTPNNTFDYSYSNIFQYSNYDSVPLTVEVHWRSDLSLHADQRIVSIPLTYPQSCLDIDHDPATCGLPVYGPPTNVSICKLVSTDQNSTLDISWDYQTDYPYPSSFYVTLYDPDPTRNIFSESFKAVNTTSVEITMPVKLVNIDTLFILRIKPFYRCSGLASKTNNYLNCGIANYQRDLSIMQLPNCPTAPASTITPSPATTDSVSDSAPTPDPTPSTVPTVFNTGKVAQSQSLIIGISAACGTAVTILLALSVAMFVTIYRCRRRPKPDWTSPNQPTFDREHSVFVAYMPHDAAEEAIQTCVVAPLLHQCHFMVVTAGRKVRGNMVEWVEEQESKATAVLFVITEDFQCAWDSTLTKSQFIEAVRRLITSSVAQGRLEDKYAIIVLDESSKRFIPANNYLRNLNTYVLGDQVQDVYNFVTKSKMFQHRNQRESSDSSLASSVGSSGVKSVCTVSVDLDSDSLGSHEDLPTSVSHSDPGLEELHAILTPNCDSVSNCDSV